MVLVSCAQMAGIDERAQKDFGIPALLLMENAARSAAECFLRLVGQSYNCPILVAAGKGNNGGDALAMARHLYIAGCAGLHVLLAAPGLGELARAQMDMLEKLKVPFSVYTDDAKDAEGRALRAGWIIDGLYGIGFKGPVKAAQAGLIEMINASPARVVSLDLPSGLGDGFRADWPVVKADYTLTFGAAKLCQYLPPGRKACGQIELLSAGFPRECFGFAPEAELVSPEDVLNTLLPRLDAADYKNSRGHIAVLAGSPGTTGAALICGEAALRAGSGLVSLFADASVYPVLAAQCRSLMVKPIGADAEKAAAQWSPSGFRAVLAGPGWGRGEDRALWLRRLLSCGLPGLIDADGLHALGAIPEGERPGLGGWVLTPHPGEAAVLLGVSRDDVLADPLPLLADFCARYGCVVVLKSHVTIICAGRRYWIHDGMNPALGTAGSGDALAGIIASLIGRGLAAADAALCGVALHAAAGREAAREKGFFTAEDLFPYISREAYRCGNCTVRKSPAPES